MGSSGAAERTAGTFTAWRVETVTSGHAAVTVRGQTGLLDVTDSPTTSHHAPLQRRAQSPTRAPMPGAWPGSSPASPPNTDDLSGAGRLIPKKDFAESPAFKNFTDIPSMDVFLDAWTDGQPARQVIPETQLELERILAEAKR